MLFFYYMFLHPYDTHVAERQLEGFDFAFIIYAKEKYFLPRSSVLERQRAYPCRECVGYAERMNCPLHLVVDAVAQRVRDLAQDDRVARGILQEEERDTQ